MCLAKASIWYDAFACVTDLIETNPQDRTLRALRDKLLGGRQILSIVLRAH